jgi:glycosyltransferase involved in cell wall biosynthesis
LIPKKGLLTTLEAFAAFRTRYPAARLTFAGSGPLLDDLQSAARSLGIAPSVSFPGFLDQPALARLYREAHLFVHPSETGPDGNREGIPNAMLEAMATGLPTVATHHGGIPEAVADRASGLLVPERDPEALAAALAEIAASPSLYDTLATGAARAIREKFDLAKQSANLEAHYQEAIERSAPEPGRSPSTP